MTPDKCRTVEICVLNLLLLVVALLALQLAEDFASVPVAGGVAGGVLTLTYYLGVYRGKAEKP